MLFDFLTKVTLRYGAQYYIMDPTDSLACSNNAR